jgi:hypothetical protein
VLALTDSRSRESHGDGNEDGGTVLVPKFHHSFDSWCKALGPVEGHRNSSPDRNFINEREGGGASYKFSDGDPIYELARRCVETLPMTRTCRLPALLRQKRADSRAVGGRPPEPTPSPDLPRH